MSGAKATGGEQPAAQRRKGHVMTLPDRESRSGQHDVDGYIQKNLPGGGRLEEVLGRRIELLLQD